MEGYREWVEGSSVIEDPFLEPYNQVPLREGSLTHKCYGSFQERHFLNLKFLLTLTLVELEQRQE